MKIVLITMIVILLMPCPGVELFSNSVNRKKTLKCAILL